MIATHAQRESTVTSLPEGLDFHQHEHTVRRSPSPLNPWSVDQFRANESHYPLLDEAVGDELWSLSEPALGVMALVKTVMMAEL